MQNNLEIEALKVLDLFGGTGCISYELASRGAPDITIVEKDSQMYEFIKKTAAELSLENFKPVKLDVFRFLDTATEQYDFIFAGPPYALGSIDDLPLKVFEKKLLKPKGWFILEHTPAHNFEKEPMFKSMRNYGTTVFSIFINKNN